MRRTNTRVYINYVGSLTDGTIFDDNRKGKPLEVLLGSSAIPRGLERELFEMVMGDERTVHLSVDDAYGHYEPEAVFKIPLNTIPNSQNLPVGEYIHWYGKKTDRPAYAKVLKIEGAHAIIDLNHPLAEKELIYWVKIVDKNTNQVPTDLGEMNLNHLFSNERQS